MIINKSIPGFLVIVISALCASPDVYLNFYDSATVNDTIVKIGDIAEVTGTDCKDKILFIKGIEVGEAAPVGYSRFLNSNDAMRRVMRGGKTGNVRCNCENKRLTVKTGFKEKTIGDFEQDIIKYVKDRIAWNAEDYTLAVINMNEKWKILNKPFDIEISGLNDKYSKGNINLKLVVIQSTKKYPVGVSCKISVCTPVVVTNSTVSRKSKFNETNCSIEKRDITNFNYIPYTKLSDVCNKTASRTVSPGTIIHEKIIAKTLDIERDEQVQVIVNNGRVKISMSALAREAGCCGDKIWVENEMTHKLLKVKIVEPGRVVLMQGEETL
jgi:flagella basal body P-ring formation protein FlgA